VVRYGAGQMEMLRGCVVEGKYHYAALTPKEESLVIRDRNELAAELPIHGARVAAKIENREALEVRITIVGMYEADPTTFHSIDLHGNCDGATHVVRALAVGAFELSSFASAARGGGVDILGAGGKIEHESEREVLNRDGDKGTCTRSSDRDTGPPYGCGALLRVEVAPVVYPASKTATSSSDCPAGFKRNGSECTAVDPSRPPLLDVLQKK
jgi:hypothetical protein